MPRDDDEFVIDITRKESINTGKTKYLRVPDGLAAFNAKDARTTYVDFIPFKVTETHLAFDRDMQFTRPGAWYPKRTFACHNNIGPDNERHLCTWTMFRRPCPVCEVRQRLGQSPRKEDTEKAWGLRPSYRQLYLLTEHDDRGELSDLLLWDEAVHNWGKQLQQWLEGTPRAKQAQYDLYWHPLDGFTVGIQGAAEKTGKGGGAYTKWSVREFQPRTQQLPREIFQHGYNLDDMLRESVYDDFKRAFLGVDEDAAAADVGRTAVHTTAQPPTGGPPPRRWGNAPVAPQNGATGHRTAPPPAPAEDDAPPPPARQAAPAPLPAPPADPEFASRDTISFKYDGDEYQGKVVKVNKDKRTLIVQVEAEGWDKPVTLDFEEVTLVAADDTFDAKPAARPAPPPPADDPSPPAPKRQAAPAAPTAAKKPRTWEEDDDQPLQRAPAAPPADEDPPPAPKRGRR